MLPCGFKVAPRPHQILGYSAHTWLLLLQLLVACTHAQPYCRLQIDPSLSSLHVAGEFIKPFKAVVQELSPNQVAGTLQLSLTPGPSAAAPSCTLQTIQNLMASVSAPGATSSETLTAGMAALGAAGPKGVQPLHVPGPAPSARVVIGSSGSPVANLTMVGLQVDLSSNTTFAISPISASPSPAPSATPNSNGTTDLTAAAAQLVAQWPRVIQSAVVVRAPGVLSFLNGSVHATSTLTSPQDVSLKGFSGGVTLEGLLVVFNFLSPSAAAQGQPNQTQGGQAALILPALQYKQPQSLQAGGLQIYGEALITLSLVTWLGPSSSQAGDAAVPQLDQGFAAALQQWMVGVRNASVVSVNQTSATAAAPAAAFGAANQTTTAPATTGVSGIAAPQQAGSAATGQTCDAVTQLNQQAAAGQSCGCQSGWRGSGCSSCTASNAAQCSTLLTQLADGKGIENIAEGATCSATMLYTPASPYGVLSCQVTGSMTSFLTHSDLYCSLTGLPPTFAFWRSVSSQLEALHGSMTTAQPRSSSPASGGIEGLGGSLSTVAGLGSGLGQGATPSSAVNGSQPYCLLYILTGEMYERMTMYCRATRCEFYEGTGDVKCSGGVACSCTNSAPVPTDAQGAPMRPGQLTTCPPDIQTLITSLTGAATMRCTSNTPHAANSTGGANSSTASIVDPAILPKDGSGTCKLTLQGLPSEVVAFCNMTGCESPAAHGLAVLAAGEPTAPKVVNWLPVIAGAPLMLSLLVALACTAYILAHRDLFTPLPKDYVPPTQHHRHDRHVHGHSPQPSNPDAVTHVEAQPLLPLSNPAGMQDFGAAGTTHAAATSNARPIAEGVESDTPGDVSVGDHMMVRAGSCRRGQEGGGVMGQRQSSLPLATAASLSVGGLTMCPGVMAHTAVPVCPPEDSTPSDQLVGFKFDAAQAPCTDEQAAQTGVDISPVTPDKPKAPIPTCSSGSSGFASGTSCAASPDAAPCGHVVGSLPSPGSMMGRPPKHPGTPAPACKSAVAGGEGGNMKQPPRQLSRVASDITNLSGDGSTSSESDAASSSQAGLCLDAQALGADVALVFENLSVMVPVREAEKQRRKHQWMARQKVHKDAADSMETGGSGGVSSVQDAELRGAGGTCGTARVLAPPHRKPATTHHHAHHHSKHRAILDHVSGSVRAGEVMGILGPSGSGKTTLLSLLSSSSAQQLGSGVRTSGTIQLVVNMRSAHQVLSTPVDVQSTPRGSTSQQAYLATAVPRDLSPEGVAHTGEAPSLDNARQGSQTSTALNNKVVVSGAKNLRKLTAFVAQADILPAYLTVAECVMYSALLRLPLTTPASVIQGRVLHVLRELRLEHVALRQVGAAADSAAAAAMASGRGNGHGVGAHLGHALSRLTCGVLGAGGSDARGLSGGEKRRVSIGMELVTEPLVIIMDEPTSGLDSYSALALLHACKELALGGRAVAMSLHQPSPELISLLDRALIMGTGGRLVYLGSMGAPLHEFLGAACLPCPPTRSPAEHLLALVSESNTLDILLATRTTQLAAQAAQLTAAVAEGAAAAGTTSASTGQQGPCSGHVSRKGTPPSATTPAVSRHATPSALLPALLAAALPGAQVVGGPDAVDGAGGSGQQMTSRPATPISRKATPTRSSTPTAETGASIAAQLAAAVVQARQPNHGTGDSPKGPPFSRDRCAAGSTGRTVAAAAAAAAAGGSTDVEAGKSAPPNTATASVAGAAGVTVLIPPEAPRLTSCARWLDSNQCCVRLRGACAQRAREISVMAWRGGVEMARNPTLLLLHILLALGAGAVVGLIFFQQPMTLPGLQNRAGVMFFSLALFAFTSLTVCDGLTQERALVAREARAGHYRATSYLAPRLALDALLLRTLPAALYTVPLYPLVGLQGSAARVATFILVLGTFGATIGALTVCAVALVNTPGKAVLLMNLCLLLQVLLGGFLVNPQSIPVWLRWLRYACPLSYAFEALTGNEVNGRSFSISVPSLPTVDAVQGEAIMTAIGLDASKAQRDVGVLVAFFTGLNLLAFLLFKRIA